MASTALLHSSSSLSVIGGPAVGDKPVVESIFHAFIADHCNIDYQVYKFYLHGRSVTEAAKHRLMASTSTYGMSKNEFTNMLVMDIQDQYRIFDSMLNLLRNPRLMPEQQLCSYPEPVQRKLVHCFYEFDDLVMKEIIGKNVLKKKTRKDIDDLSEKLKIPVMSCRRQFDNLQNVYKKVEEDKGCLWTTIKSHFLLDDNLARRYAYMCFLCDHRFDVSKRKLSSMSLVDFEEVAAVMMGEWTDHAGQMDLSTKYTSQIRDLKTVLGPLSDEFKQNVVHTLVAAGFAKDVVTKVQSRFAAFWKDFLLLGAGLSSTKEFRDFFWDLYELTEMLKIKMGLKLGDIDVLCSCLIKAYGEVPTSKMVDQQRTERARTWEQYVDGVRNLVKYFFVKI